MVDRRVQLLAYVPELVGITVGYDEKDPVIVEEVRRSGPGGWTLIYRRQRPRHRRALVSSRAEPFIFRGLPGNWTIVDVEQHLRTLERKDGVRMRPIIQRSLAVVLPPDLVGYLRRRL